MTMLDSEAPQIDARKIMASMDAPLVVGETWFLVAMDWFQKFKAYSGLSSATVLGDSHPGPISNRSLMAANGRLKPCLVDQDDYVLVPERTWHALVAAFGVDKTYGELPRQVIETGDSRTTRVEVYKLHLKLCHNTTENGQEAECSVVETVSGLRRELQNRFGVSATEDARVWLHTADPREFKALTNWSSPLESAEVNDGDTIILEVKKNGSWPLQRLLEHTKDSRNRHRSQPGICGLQNLGNTCFMNSVLQCMSNTPPVTAYFLSEKHLEELNRNNPLGTQGALAVSYGDLLKVIWSGDNSSVSPRNFKMQVSRFAPQFSGCLQHDAHELLIFLLDGLHEDLNRIRSKPYIELREADGRSDDVVAREAWDNYLKRNDSIMVQIFHGLLKSTVVCPECGKVSVTFDPNPPYALPLPFQRERTITVLLVPKEGAASPVEYRLSVSRDALLKDVIDVLASGKVHVEAARFALVSVGSFSRILKPTDRLSDLPDREKLHIYEVDKDLFSVAVKCRRKSTKTMTSFGVPFFVCVPKRTTTAEVVEALVRKMERIYKPSDQMDTGESDFSLSLSTGHGKNVQELTDNEPVEFLEGEDYELWLNWKEEALVRRVLNEAAFTEYTQRQSILYSPKKPIGLKDCFRLFTTTETLRGDNAWYCPKCKVHQEATKKIDIWSLPDILIVQLKRFSYTRHSRDKIEAFVDYPTRSLDLSEFVIAPRHPDPVYDLIGVSNHYGGLGGGHYTSYCRNKDDGHWYHFDDSSVSRVSESDVVSKSGYVLFYQRRGSRVAVRYPSVSMGDDAGEW
ncbi:unnamed protein product [Notodromas monacha]|uniref:Ubiquitin carboxyl-terminal hydrolase n=1 Tax=Notodromas monacha TaxID=399045 RepID=A0A7R9BWY6_9CRUS|nr:unnamed protein product [Notodromas monacha]CAG0921929.1 unnamed protein product [Notodromas monacha]